QKKRQAQILIDYSTITPNIRKHFRNIKRLYLYSTITSSRVKVGPKPLLQNDKE
ncbi:24655_t:CDS:1, partial [Gigaspora rosea]